MSRIGKLFDRFRPARDSSAEEWSAAESRWIIAGLGNPGEQYHRSRHNIGFMAIDRLAARYQVELTRRRFSGVIAEVREADFIAHLVKPQTFYNRSGDCLAPLMGYYKTPVERLIVIHDELDLPMGQLRLKRGGSDAGNRGVRSIAAAVGPEFTRIRVGIGHPGDANGEIEHVLRPLSRSELDALQPVFERAIAGAVAVIRDGLERAMNQFNQRA